MLEQESMMITKNCLVVLKEQRLFGPFASISELDMWTSGHIVAPYVVVSLYPPADVGKGEKAHECGTIVQVAQ
jgi:hypothetical protein